MGRLKGRELPSRIGKATSRLQRKDADEAARHRRRDAEKAWRSWRKTARWQKLRLKILRRDAVDISDRPDLIPRFVLFPGAPLLWPQCQKTGVILMGKHPAPDSPVADHICPHRGDPGLFWDEDNLQTVSKAWHDREKQSGSTPRACDPVPRHGEGGLKVCTLGAARPAPLSRRDFLR